MATNSFVIDPQQLEQAKAYAKAAAEENMEFYERMGKLIERMYVAIDGIQSNMGDQGFNNQIANQRGNLTNLQKRFKENSQRAEKLCDMIQTGLDQGEITEQGLAGMLQSMTDFLMDVLGFSHADTASKTGGQMLGATKAVAVSGAALAGTFGLVQPASFTSLGDLVNRLFQSIRQKLQSIFPKGGGGGGVQAAPDSGTKAPAQQPPTSESIKENTKNLTANILDTPDENLPKVGANRIQFKDKDGQINCLWLARQKMCAIVGDDELFTSKKLGIKADNWKKYEETGINGFSVDYRTVSSGTKMTDLVEILKNDQPCSAMFYLNGHTFTVDRIQDGKVYWTDNFTPVGEKPYYKTGVCTMFDGDVYKSSYTGLSTSASLEEFAKWYDKFAGAPKSYVILREK